MKHIYEKMTSQGKFFNYFDVHHIYPFINKYIWFEYLTSETYIWSTNKRNMKTHDFVWFGGNWNSLAYTYYFSTNIVETIVNHTFTVNKFIIVRFIPDQIIFV